MTLLFILAVHSGNDLLRSIQTAVASQVVGSTSNGQLLHGKRLPTRGANFVTYSRLGSLIGRTCVADRLHDTILAAIAAHLLALDASRRAYGLKIERVIFAPELRDALFNAAGGKKVRERIKLDALFWDPQTRVAGRR